MIIAGEYIDLTLGKWHIIQGSWLWFFHSSLFIHEESSKNLERSKYDWFSS